MQRISAPQATKQRGAMPLRSAALLTTLLLASMMFLTSASSQQQGARAAASPPSPPAAAVYAPGTSPTRLGKTLNVRSNHTIASAVIKDTNVQRTVNVTGSKDVRVTQPRLAVTAVGDTNTHMSLTDTDALDVSDDEAFDLVATGNAKVIAGEMDDVASVFPNGCITHVAGSPSDGNRSSSSSGCGGSSNGGSGSTPSAVPANIPPSNLDTNINVSATFNVPSRIGSGVRIQDATAVHKSSSVYIEGANVDIKSSTSRNTQIITDDADLADVADNGGTTGMATGNAIVITGEVEEPVRGATGTTRPRPGSAPAKEEEEAELPEAGAEPAPAPAPAPAAAPKTPAPAAQRQGRRMRSRKLLLFIGFQGPLRADASASAAGNPATSSGSGPVAMSLGVESHTTNKDAAMDFDMTMNITNRVRVDVSRNVTDAHNVRLSGQDVRLKLDSENNRQLEANGSSVFNVDVNVGCGGGRNGPGPSRSSGWRGAGMRRLGGGGGASQSTNTSVSASGAYKIIFNILNYVHIDARQSVANSRNVTVDGSRVDVNVTVANNTQLTAANSSIGNVLAQAGCAPLSETIKDGPADKLELPLPHAALVTLSQALHGIASRIALGERR